MKNYAPLFIAIASVFSLGGFAQPSDHIPANVKMANTQLISDMMTNDELVVVSYRVEERINMRFGGHVTTYNVSDLNLVAKNDLGPDNTRIVTPVYAKAKVRPMAKNVSVAASVAALSSEQPKASIAMIPVAASVKTDVAVPKESMTVNIDIISTYERILDKGYKSVDMLKKVANSRFFDGELVTAAKWYTQLFAQAKDLEVEYYYRYAQSLKSINQVEKANEMMAFFNKNK